MNGRMLLAALSCVVLGLLIWHLRWVLLVLFGAVVLAVAMDVLIHQLQKRSRLNRPQALILVLLGLALAGTVVATLLLPELVVQIQQLSKDLPQLVEKLTSLLSADPRLSQLEDNLSGDVNFSKLQPIGAQLLGVAGGAANSLVQAFLMALLAVLLALDPQAHRDMLIAVSPRPARERVASLLMTAARRWAAG